MRVQAFLYRHYSSAVGESPAGHAIAIVLGGLMMAVGVALAVSIVFVPVGVVLGVLGFLVCLEGVFAHIERPLKLRDLVDAVIGLTGAAIAVTFVLAILFFLVSFGAGTFAGVLDWLRQVI